MLTSARKGRNMNKFEELHLDEIRLDQGDIVLVKGNSLISRLIRIFTRHIGEKRTKVNHVGMITGTGWIASEFWQAEITEAVSKVRTKELNKAYGPPRRYQVAVYRPTNLTPEQIRIVAETALAHVGQSYGYCRIVAHALDRLFLGIYFFRRLIPNNKYPICSWLVAHAYGKVGKNFGVPTGMADPDDIWDFLQRPGSPYVCIWPLGPLPDTSIDWGREEELFVRRCRICGCSDDDCLECIECTGEPCRWVEDDLCSACAAEREADIICSNCGKKMYFFYEAYCILSGRGANSNCIDHLGLLLCGKCADNYFRKT